MVRRRPVYSPEFRAEAIRRVRTSDESANSIAKDLGVSCATLRTWVEATRPKPEVPLTDDERSELRRLRKETDLPLAVGFGISKREHVVALQGLADAAIVGAALVDRVESSPRSECVGQVRRYVEVLTGRMEATT